MMRCAGVQLVTKIEELIEKARGMTQTAEQREAQRRSFAYGNIKIENPRVTREMINRAADAKKR